MLWMILGISVTIVIWSLLKWNCQRDVPFRWWEWLTIGIWGIALVLTAAFMGTTLGEGEPQATLRGGIFFGLIIIITGVGLWRRLLTSKKVPEKKSKGVSA